MWFGDDRFFLDVMEGSPGRACNQQCVVQCLDRCQASRQSVELDLSFW